MKLKAKRSTVPGKKRIRLIDSGDSYDDPDCDSDDEETKISSSKQLKLDEFIKPKNLSVDLNLATIKLTCLEIFIVN